MDGDVPESPGAVSLILLYCSAARGLRNTQFGVFRLAFATPNLGS
jgi:hypothetical protein